MRYDPSQPEMVPVLFFTLFLSVVGFILTFKLINKWKKRKVFETLYLSLVFAFLVIGATSLSIGLLEAIITGYRKEIYMFTLPLAYCCVVVADIFLFVFASHITNSEKNAIIPITVIGICLIIVIFLPWNWWGQPAERYAGKPSIRTYTSFGFVIYSCIIYIAIAIICLRTKKIAEKKVTRTGLSLLFYSVMSMIGFFIMIMCDNLMITIYHNPGYTIFNIIAWIFAILFVILSYLSLIMPNWLVKKIEKK